LSRTGGLSAVVTDWLNIVPVQRGRRPVSIEPNANAAIPAADADNGTGLVGEARATNCPEFTHLETSTDREIVYSPNHSADHIGVSAHKKGPKPTLLAFGRDFLIAPALASGA